jgi:hypothetical protein
LTVLPVPVGATGRGRLIHPTFGTYDYPMPPDEWVNLRGDAIIAPIWASTKTLLGAANTLFVGDVRDVICEERWTQGIVYGGTAHADALIAMWSNPPDPSVAYVQWFPNYSSTQGFNVVLLGLTLGQKDITTSSLSHGGHDRGPLILRLRIASRIV